MDKNEKHITQSIKELEEKENNIYALDQSFIGKVIMIPDEYTVVVEISDKFLGELSKGDKVMVCELGDLITNLEKEVLGYFTFTKGELTIVEVAANYIICKDVYTYTTSSILTNLGGAMNALYPQTKQDTRKLLINEKDNLDLKMKNPKISINDWVKVSR